MNWVKQHVILLGIHLSWKLFKDVYEKTEPHTCGWSGKVEEGHMQRKGLGLGGVGSHCDRLQGHGGHSGTGKGRWGCCGPAAAAQKHTQS